MTFKPNVPQPSDYMSSSQIDLLRNNTTIEQVFNVNHVPMTNSLDEDRGKHKCVSFISQASDPTTTTQERAVYTKDDSGVPNLFMRGPSDGTVSKLTKDNAWMAVLKVLAYVTFDKNGNILKDPYGTQLSYNVASVTPGAIAAAPFRFDNYTITYENALPTDNYFWNISPQFGPLIQGNVVDQTKPVTVTPTVNAVYTDSVSTAFIKLSGYTVSSVSNVSIGRIATMKVVIYGLAT